MTPTPFISVCIPAYKNIAFLTRLLDSIAVQSYTNYEVIITDDSPDDALEKFARGYRKVSPLHYYRNAVSLGTPENWNEAIRKASGDWIKLMHDDDWFSNASALAEFAAAATSSYDFIFSAYENIYADSKRVEPVRLSAFMSKRLTTSPLNLLARNLVGPPSVTLYRRSAITYDRRMKWKVDIDFYIRYLQEKKFRYINKPLVKVGIGAEQVTQDSFLVPGVEIPENFLLLEKIGVSELQNWLAYDSWWRLFRNLGIRSVEEIRAAGFSGEIPQIISAMLADQRKLPLALLRIGALSKLFMFASLWRQKKLAR